MKYLDMIQVRSNEFQDWQERKFLAHVGNELLCEMPDGNGTYTWPEGRLVPVEPEAVEPEAVEPEAVEPEAVEPEEAPEPPIRNAYAPFTADTFPRQRVLLRSLKLRSSSYNVVTSVRQEGVTSGRHTELVGFRTLLERWDISIDNGKTWHPAGQL